MADQITLYPNGVGDEFGVAGFSGAATAWQAVQGDDSDTSYIYDSTATGGRASKVSILVKGGTYEASPYKITLKAVTNNVIPHKWELDVFMRVKEI